MLSRHGVTHVLPGNNLKKLPCLSHAQMSMTFDNHENCISFIYDVILGFRLLFVLHYTITPHVNFCLFEIECAPTVEVFDT